MEHMVISAHRSGSNWVHQLFLAFACLLQPFLGHCQGCGMQTIALLCFSNGMAVYQNMQHSLQEYARGLWIAVRVARTKGWRVRVYHDGSVNDVLQRFRAHFDPNDLEIVRVRLPPDLLQKKYLCCLLRLMAFRHPFDVPCGRPRKQHD